MNNGDFKNILSSGLIIKTKFPSSDIWIANIIESVKNDIIFIPINDEYFKEDILNEDSIVIEFADHERQYVIDGRLLDIDIVSTQTISVKILKISVYENDRKSERYYINLGANVSSSNNQTGSTSIVTNISTNGIYFISKQKHKKGETVTIDILVHHDRILTFKGEIIRSESCKYGQEHAIKLFENAEISKNIEELIGIVDSKITKLRSKIQKKPSNAFLNAKVLLVEPSTLIRTMVKNAINSLGIANVYEAGDVNKALNSAKINSPDIVFISYIVSEIDNNNVLEELKNINSNVRIVLLSATPKSEIDSNVLTKYKVEYISKTDNYEMLYNSIVEKIRG